MLSAWEETHLTALQKPEKKFHCELLKSDAQHKEIALLCKHLNFDQHTLIFKTYWCAQLGSKPMIIDHQQHSEHCTKIGQNPCLTGRQREARHKVLKWPIAQQQCPEPGLPIKQWQGGQDWYSNRVSQQVQTLQ